MKLRSLLKEGDGVDLKKLAGADGITVGQAEEKRLRDAGVEIPVYPEQGPILYDGNEVGFADNFNGVSFFDKDFIKEFVKDAQWYVNPSSNL